MYKINNTINSIEYKGLKAGKLLDINAKEILSISLEKGTVLPKHASPTDANLLVLEGTISFFIKGIKYNLLKHQIFNFPKDEEHWVEANENSKFLIIR